MTTFYEVNFDCLVGPTHNYSGLSLDNLASLNSLGKVSNPKEAALQGLKKMKLIADLGLKQAILPPHPRPDISFLKTLGFAGTDDDILRKSSLESPKLLSACSSAAYIWTANAATVTPSSDSLDKKLHITPANLNTELHRSIEVTQTLNTLKAIFNNQHLFKIHPPLPSSGTIADEGAANHTRLCPEHGMPGLHLFVYGRSGLEKSGPIPKKFYPRQTLESCQAIARRHGINPKYAIFIQQNPEAIDAGVFHNDLISVGNENVFLFHEKAFINTKSIINELRTSYHALYNSKLYCLEVPESRIPLDLAVKTYLFNSQIVTLKNKKMAIIAPTHCEKCLEVKTFLEELVEGDNPIESVRYVNVEQSMHNGGGPACLRLRVVLNEKELDALPPSIFMNDTLYNKLTDWVKTHYRDQLKPKDLGSIELANESKRSSEALGKILNLNQ